MYKRQNNLKKCSKEYKAFKKCKKYKKYKKYKVFKSQLKYNNNLITLHKYNNKL